MENNTPNKKPFRSRTTALYYAIGRALRLIFSIIVIVAAGVAAALITNSDDNNPSSATATPNIVETFPDVEVDSDDSDNRLLVWSAGGGAKPGEQALSNPGQLLLVDQSGNTESVLDVPEGTRQIRTCGDRATSPDRRFLVLYVGGDVGDLYIMQDDEFPERLDDVTLLTCIEGGSFQFAPDSSRFAYIEFPEGVTPGAVEFLTGLLRVYDSESRDQEENFDNVASFDMTADGLIFVSFFTNDDGNADEASVGRWDGETQIELAQLLPLASNCRFTNARIRAMPDDTALLIMGHRCRGEDTSWQLYELDPGFGSLTLVATDFQSGVFAPFARTNNLWRTPGGTTAVFTVPDSITANTAAVAIVETEDFFIDIAIERQAIMPTFSGSANALPRLSRNGRWLGLVVTSPNDENTLYALDLANPNSLPLTVRTPGQDDVISNLEFTPDSAQLLFVSGGRNSEENSLMTLDLTTGNTSRIQRGRFDQTLILSPSGGVVALADWQQPERSSDGPFLNLVLINVADGATTTLAEGADIEEGRVVSRRFSYPLAWR